MGLDPLGFRFTMQQRMTSIILSLLLCLAKGIDRFHRTFTIQTTLKSSPPNCHIYSLSWSSIDINFVNAAVVAKEIRLNQLNNPCVSSQQFFDSSSHTCEFCSSYISNTSPDPASKVLMTLYLTNPSCFPAPSLTLLKFYRIPGVTTTVASAM